MAFDISQIFSFASLNLSSRLAISICGFVYLFLAKYSIVPEDPLIVGTMWILAIFGLVWWVTGGVGQWLHEKKLEHKSAKLKSDRRNERNRLTYSRLESLGEDELNILVAALHLNTQSIRVRNQPAVDLIRQKRFGMVTISGEPPHRAATITFNDEVWICAKEMQEKLEEKLRTYQS